MRHVNERTKNIAKLQLESYFKIPVHEVTSAPFADTLIKSYELAANLNSTWTLMVDADVIPLEKIVTFVQEITEGDKYSGCTPLVLDKLWQYPRSAGIHLYRTSVIDEIISELGKPKINEELRKSTRPETYCKQLVCGHKKRWGLYGEVAGLHDFEQSFEDIYRTTTYFAKKWSEPIALKIPMWIEKGKIDPDFRFALLGFANGLQQISTNFETNRPSNLQQEFELLSSKYQKKEFTDKDRNNLIIEIKKSNLGFYLNKKMIRTSKEDLIFPDILERVTNLFKRYKFHNAFKLLLAKFGRYLEKDIFKIH